MAKRKGRRFSRSGRPNGKLSIPSLYGKGYKMSRKNEPAKAYMLAIEIAKLRIDTDVPEEEKR